MNYLYTCCDKLQQLALHIVKTQVGRYLLPRERTVPDVVERCGVTRNQVLNA